MNHWIEGCTHKKRTCNDIRKWNWEDVKVVCWCSLECQPSPAGIVPSRLSWSRGEARERCARGKVGKRKKGLSFLSSFFPSSPSLRCRPSLLTTVRYHKRRLGTSQSRLLPLTYRERPWVRERSHRRTVGRSSTKHQIFDHNPRKTLQRHWIWKSRLGNILVIIVKRFGYSSEF